MQVVGIDCCVAAFAVQAQPLGTTSVHHAWLQDLCCAITIVHQTRTVI